MKNFITGYIRSVLVVIISTITVSVHAQEIKRAKITDVAKIISESKTPLIVNMWATWCGPCVEELPYFIKEVNAHARDSVQFLMVSLDFKESFPDGMKEFMKKRKIDHATLWLDETNADYFCPKIDPKWEGAIPATLFIDNKTGYRKFIDEKIKHEDFAKELAELIRQR